MNTCRPSGGKDRHLKVNTSKGPRDRRIRLSVSAAIQLYDIQDRLGYNQPSKAVEWLIKNAQNAINELQPLPFIEAGKLATENQQDIAEPVASIEAALVGDRLPKSQPFLDVHSSTCGLMLLKRTYDSRTLESTLRTFNQVSNAHGLDFDGLTRSDQEKECEHAESREGRYYTGSIPEWSMSEACCDKVDVGCSLTVKNMDPRFQATEKAKERANVRSLFKATGQQLITSKRFMPSEIGRPLQSIFTDNDYKGSGLLNSSPCFQSSQPEHCPFPVQVTFPDPLLNSTQILQQNTAGNNSLEAPRRFFAAPAQPAHENVVDEMLLQSSIDRTRLQLRPIANDVLLGSDQQRPVLSSISTKICNETPANYPAPAIYQYLLSMSAQPLIHALATSNQFSPLGLSNYSQQEAVAYNSPQAHRLPEFPPAPILIHPNAPAPNIIHNGHNSWQGWPQPFGGQLLNTNCSSTRRSMTRPLPLEEIRPNDHVPAFQFYQLSDVAMRRSRHSPSPPALHSLVNREDSTGVNMSSARGTFRSLTEVTESMGNVFNSEEHPPPSV